MRALFVSPHLDDAVFSCGALLAMQAKRGWQVTVATVFTRSAHPATGFALECQRDKGLADEVDYMALRRDEDSRALRQLGVEPEHLDLAEAPHRGYESAEALFGPFASADDPAPIDAAVAACVARHAPDMVFGPSALGGHVDHRRVLDALLALGEERPIAFWRDTPYITRADIAPLDARVAALDDIALPIGETLTAKLEACACYDSQVEFQFGGAHAMEGSLRELALREGGGVAAERLHATPAALRLLHG